MIFYTVTHYDDMMTNHSYFATKKEAIDCCIEYSIPPSERDIKKCIIEDNKRGVIAQFNQCAVENN